MKRCPSCQQTYDDDALSFCPADGTRLENERAAASLDLQATIMAPPPPSPPPLSESFGAEPPPMSGYETNATPSFSGFDTSTPPTSTPSWESLPTSAPQQHPFPAPPAAPVGAKSRRPLAAYITIGAAIIIAGFLFFIWLIGLIAGIGGSLIHLLLVLALLIGFIGIAVGIFLLVMSKRQ